MTMIARAWWLLFGALLAGCSASPPAQPAQPQPTPAAAPAAAATAPAGASVDIRQARALGRPQLFSWAAWSKETFERARRDGRPILLHGAASWCHWCHVMEEATYRDPQVGALIRDRFVAIRIDIDARPDIEERYGEWGWPATIVLSPAAEELGKYRGYLPAARMLAKLNSALDSDSRRGSDDLRPQQGGAPVDALWWIGANYTLRMDSFYDERQGGWGFRQKAPIGDNVVFELRRYGRGDEAALTRARTTLRKQAALIDPVWGGIYQYSTGQDWTQPHYEKLMTYQAESLWAYADGYRHTGDPQLLGWARDIERYMNSFLSSDAGGFLVAQDADVGSHDREGSFVDGASYYRLDDAGRRKLGVPRVDEHVYAEENGLAIAAMCALLDATGDRSVFARAKRAAERVLATHVDEQGRVLHDADSKRGVYDLADAAAFGFALMRLSASADSDSERQRYRQHAKRIAEAMVGELSAPSGAFYAHTPDPDASGVFTRRRTPYRGNVHAARLLAALAESDGGEAYRERARAALAAIAVPQVLRERGRMIGGYLLALDEAGALRW